MRDQIIHKLCKTKVRNCTNEELDSFLNNPTNCTSPKNKIDALLDSNPDDTIATENDDKDDLTQEEP